MARKSNGKIRRRHIERTLTKKKGTLPKVIQVHSTDPEGMVLVCTNCDQRVRLFKSKQDAYRAMDISKDEESKYRTCRDDAVDRIHLVTP